MLQVKLNVRGPRFDEIKQELLARGIEVTDTATLILSEADAYAKWLVGQANEERHCVQTENIIYIESFSHDIIAHTTQGDFKLGERLRQLEGMLDPEYFLRISNSVIIARGQISGIRPTLYAKLILTMSNGDTVDVTRSYYYIFKEQFGI